MQVLNSINWSLVKFDVLCIETDPPNRPKGYAEEMTAFLKKKGYENKYGQIGRNICKFFRLFVSYFPLLAVQTVQAVQ